jgi:uncharacterized protein
MPLLVNLRHLEAHNVQLKGELQVDELDIDTKDEVIRVAAPLEHEAEVQQLEDALLAQGRLKLPLVCQCVRCLKPFPYLLELDPWTLHLPLEGEDAAPVENDCVDLTPYVREDILLEFPQHPLCDPDCEGLPQAQAGEPRRTKSTDPSGPGSPAWNELNKLKF